MNHENINRAVAVILAALFLLAWLVIGCTTTVIPPDPPDPPEIECPEDETGVTPTDPECLDRL